MARIIAPDFDKYDVVSCDVFDTLLFRNSVYPKNLWRRKGKFFKFFRPKAEFAARCLGRIKGKEEISIEDIYRFMKPIWATSKEIELEESSLVVNTEVLEWLNLALANGKRIILISDTYLSSEVMKSFLLKLNVPNFEIITSSSLGKTKSKNLFPYLIAEEGISPENWLHIGDNHIADVERPSEFGIHTFLYTPIFKQLLLTGVVSKKGFKKLARSAKGQVALTAAANDLLQIDTASKSSDNFLPEIIGTIVLAPVALEIARWVGELAIELNVQLVCFIGRDGWLPFTAYRKISFETPVTYLETSRKAIGATLFQEYLGMKIGSSESVLIYDIGWRGSGLAKMQHTFKDISWHGAFLALVRSSNKNESTYFSRFGKNWWWAIGNRDVLETLFSDEKESTVGYNDNLSPIRSSTNSDSPQELRKTVVRAAINAISNFKTGRTEVGRISLLEMLCKFPSAQFATLFIGSSHQVADSRSRPFLVNSFPLLRENIDVSWWPGTRALKPQKLFTGTAWMFFSRIQQLRYGLKSALRKLRISL